MPKLARKIGHDADLTEIDRIRLRAEQALCAKDGVRGAQDWEFAGYHTLMQAIAISAHPPTYSSSSTGDFVHACQNALQRSPMHVEAARGL